MKRVLAIAIVCTLSSAFCRAESASITHNFNTMISGGTLTWPTPGVYTVGNTDFVTYTGTNGGTFSYDGAHYVFSLPSNTSTLTITPAVAGLTRVWMTHSKGASPDWIKVYISYNGSDWVLASTTYSSTLIDATTPGAAEYYIKIVNEDTSKPVNILTIHYVYDPTPCNCFPYIAP